MKRLLLLGVLVGLALSACSAEAATLEADKANQQDDVTVFKAPN